MLQAICQVEEPLGSQNPLPLRQKEIPEAIGMKRAAVPEDKARNPALLGFGYLLAAQGFQPTRRPARPDQARFRVQRSQDSFKLPDAHPAHQIRLVQDDDVGKLNLIDQKLRDCPLILLFDRQPAFSQLRSFPIVIQEARSIDDRDQRIAVGKIRKGPSQLILKCEGLRDRHRLRNARWLDQEIVEAAPPSEIRNLFQ